MNELKVFESSEFGSVRTILIDKVPFFVGKDVAEILGYTDTYGALKKHVDDEDKQNCQNDSFETPRGMTVINEIGLYSLVLSSKLPYEKKFKKWVTSEVLPSIRKHGMYAVDEVLNNPDMLIAALTELKAEREKNNILSEKIEQDKPKTVFADAVSASKTSILIGDLAKLICQNGVKNGCNVTTKTPVVTGKGQIYFINMFLDKEGIR